MKGYKIFNPDFTCRDMKFEENKTFEVPLPISVCNRGIHFCTKASHCFSYYAFDPKNIVCEVEALGEVQTHSEDSKACTNKLHIGRRLTWQEVLVVANEGSNNTGHSNTGYRNTGNWNTGDRNTGYRNTGDRNTGYRNTGNWNTGNWNTGNWNTGDRNTGDSNTGYRNSGAFCIDPNPKLVLFDKLTDINVKDWEQSRAVDIMSSLLETTMWIYSENMSAEEKENYPTHTTTGGYLKTKTLHEAWADMWGNLKEEERNVFLELPGFDADKFELITGIKV